MSWTIPVKTDFMKTQADHKPSMDYAEDIYQVIRAYIISTKAEPIALEIGAAWGFSTLAMLEAGVKHLTSVDPNEQAQGKNESTANGYTNHVWTQTFSKEFWATNDTKFDLIYVDGSHNYEDVKLDLYEAWKQLNKGGLLMADDWDHKNNILVKEGQTKPDYGVSLACFEFWRDRQNEIDNAGVNGRVLWFRK